MANVSMNLGDKLIFDANDATNPNTTFLTNPTGAPNPSNTIEVWLNGALQAEFKTGRLTLLDSDLAFTRTNPRLLCKEGVIVQLDAEDIHGANTSLRINAGVPNSTELTFFEFNANRFTSWTGIRLSAPSDNDRYIDTGAGQLEIAAVSNINLRANSKNSAGTSKVKVFDYTSEVASLESAAINLNSPTNVNNSLTISGITTMLSTLVCAGPGVFGGKVDGVNAGIRTKSVSGANPTGGDPGDIQVRSDTSKLFVNVGGTWKSVTLA